MLLIASPSRVAFRDAHHLFIDAALHAEMLRIRELVGPRIACVCSRVPERELADQPGTLRLAAADVPYQLRPLDQAWEEEPRTAVREQIEQHLRDASVVVGAQGTGLGGALFDQAVERGVPTVVLVGEAVGAPFGALEASKGGPLRWVFAAARAKACRRAEDYQVELAAAVRCRGYLSLAACAERNPGSTLLLGSRLGEAELLDPARIARRVDTLMEGRRPRLVWSGAFEDSDGVLDVIRLAVELRKAGADLRLQVFGRGSQKAEMLRLLAQGGAQHVVQVLPPLPWRDQQAVMAQADVVLGTGRGDAVLPGHVEAMGLGLPVVGFARGPLPALAEASGACLLVADGNLRAAARSLRRLLRNRERLTALSLAARGFALEHCAEASLRRTVESARPWLAAASVPAPAAPVDLAAEAPVGA